MIININHRKRFLLPFWLETGTFKHLAKAILGSANRTGPVHSKILCTVEWDKVPVVYIKNTLGKVFWVVPISDKDKLIHRTAFAQGPECTWWVMQKDGNVYCVPQGNLMLGKNSQLFDLYDVNCYTILRVIITMVAICLMNNISTRIT